MVEAMAKLQVHSEKMMENIQAMAATQLAESHAKLDAAYKSKLDEAFAAMRTEIDDKITGVQDAIGTTGGEVTELRNEVRELKEIVSTLKQEISDRGQTADEQGDQLVTLDKNVKEQQFATKATNVVMYGLSESAGENISQQVATFFENTLKIDRQISNFATFSAWESQIETACTPDQLRSKC